MKTILWKEIRENLKWAILGCVCLALAEFYALSTDRGDSGSGFEGRTLVSASFLMVSSFGCAIVAAALGTLQILPERRRDQWAALLHRPVSRGRILLGKVVAGVLLYFLATGIPFLASAVFVAMPGQFAYPFVPGLLIPGLSDLLLGVVFYFLAVLLCLHRGRWFGSRGAIALCGVAAFTLSTAAGFSFLLPMGMSLIFAIAAWGAIQSNGAMHALPTIARLATIAAIGTGAYAALILAGLLVDLWPGKPAHATHTYTQFQITQTGEVLVATSKGDGSDAKLTYPDGTPVTDPRYAGNNDGGQFIYIYSLAWGLDEKSVTDLQAHYSPRFPRHSQNYIVPGELSYGSQESWYYLVRERTLVGFDKLSRLCVGTADAMGFFPPGHPGVAFDQPVRSQPWSAAGNSLYWSTNQLYRINFGERSVDTVLSVENDSIRGALNLAPRMDQQGLTAVALDRGIRVFAKDGKELVTIPYRHDTRIWNSVSMATNAAKDRLFVQYQTQHWGRRWSQEAAGKPVLLDVIDLNGNLVDSFSHPSPVPTIVPASFKDWFYIATTPSVPALLATTYRHIFSPNELFYGGPSFPLQPSVIKFERLPVLFGTSLILAALAWIWARRSGLPARRTLPWVIFVFCFNLPALIAFRLGTDWPTRVRCQKCHRKRPVADEFCPLCGAAWPLPEKNGSEVFDHANASLDLPSVAR